MIRVSALLCAMSLAAACSAPLGTAKDSPFAPGAKPGAEAVDGMLVGHRLMQAGEYELALDAFTRAAADEGMTAEVISALGTANLGLGRLGQAERLLRRAVTVDQTSPEAWNNLGVVLMEQGKYPEASQMFQRAYAFDNGESDSIRDNLRKALAKTENPDYDAPEEQDYKLVRRGSSEFLIHKIP